VELRLGFNQASTSCHFALGCLCPDGPTPWRTLLPDGLERFELTRGDQPPVRLWQSPINLSKEAMARRLFYDVPLATDYVIRLEDDGGKTWSASNQGLGHTGVQELAISPSLPRVVYCTLRTTARDSAPWNGGVCRSEDEGRTWARRSQGLARVVGKRDSCFDPVAASRLRVCFDSS
jgi:hypothetical protein